MKVKYLLLLNDNPWADIYYRCGHCSAPTPSYALERHARDEHGIEDIEIVEP